jgi:hypothetical protein
MTGLRDSLRNHKADKEVNLKKKSVRKMKRPGVGPEFQLCLIGILKSQEQSAGKEIIKVILE